MVSPRPYRATPGPRAAAVELRRESGKQFDPAVVEAFLALLARGGVPEVFETPVTPELLRGVDEVGAG
jgi:HD-GYP domain-containing protein (c-di-GMP phosphodiesterase class II)